MSSFPSWFPSGFSIALALVTMGVSAVPAQALQGAGPPPAAEAHPPAAPRPGISGAADDPSRATNPVPDDIARARTDITITGYDLAVQIDPAGSKFTALARLTLRNDGRTALPQIALQVSSSLQWDSVSSDGVKLQYTQARVETDADHTGGATEAAIHLPRPLSPGQSVHVTAFYSGTITRATGRLERLDVPQSKAEKIEWDRIEPNGTYLRGFGDVLWYPVAAVPALLGDGAALAREDGRQKLRQSQSTVQLRVSVMYGAAPPRAVFFCGMQGSLALTPPQESATDAPSGGLATAEFAPQTLGFRPMHLFLLDTSPESAGDLMDVVGGSRQDRETLRTSASDVAPLLSEWLGVSPGGKLTLVVQDGQSFADGAFVVAPAAALQDRPVMAGALTHAWFHSAQPWLDRSVAELMSVLWLERSRGRPAALAQIEDEAHALSLAESNVTDASGDQGGLLTASDEVGLRNKSVAVLFMLRAIAGDDALRQALQRVRLNPGLDRDPHGFQQALERTSGKPLGWFFDDWLYHDRGLPDLQIVSVSPREVEGRAGQTGGALVAVEVQNRGGAVAEVPVTVRSGALTATERLRVPAHASASVRIVFQGTPEEVEVNDGSVPELAESTHLRRLKAQP